MHVALEPDSIAEGNRETLLSDVAVGPKGESLRPKTPEAHIERALMALAVHNGNSRKAAKALAEDGIHHPFQTIWGWQKIYAERYEAIRAEVLPALRAQQAEAHRQLAQRQLEGSLEAADLVAERLPKMEDKDLVNAMGKFDIGTGIHTEKALLLEGQPTQIVQRTSEQIYRELEAEGLKVEEIEAEVVGEEDVSTNT